MRITPVDTNVTFTFNQDRKPLEEIKQPKPIDSYGITFKGILDSLSNQVPYYRPPHKQPEEPMFKGASRPNCFTSFTGHWPPYYKNDEEVVWYPKQLVPPTEEGKGEKLNFIV